MGNGAGLCGVMPDLLYPLWFGSEKAAVKLWLSGYTCVSSPAVSDFTPGAGPGLLFISGNVALAENDGKLP